MKNNNTLITIIIAIVVAAVAFFGGMQYGKSQAATTINDNGQFAQRQGGQNGSRFGGRRGLGGATIGKIINQDANSITVQLQDSSSKIINISDSTRITKTDTASKSDLTSGQTVAAFGMTNSDGSITAQNVQINPMFRGGQGSPRPTQ